MLCSNLRIDGDFDIRQLAQKTPGYVGADLTALVNEASLFAVSRAAADLVSSTAIATATTPGAGLAPGGAVQQAAAAAVADGTVATAAASSTPMEEEGHAVKAPPAVAEGEGGAGSSSSAAAAEADPAHAQQPTLQMKFEVKSTEDNRGTLDERAESSNRIREQTTPFTAEQMKSLFVTLQDFESALPRVQPSAKREGFATVPEVSWDDVGALAGPRRELEDAAVLPLTNPELCRKVGIPRPPGVLLYGQ